LVTAVTVHGYYIHGYYSPELPLALPAESPRFAGAAYPRPAGMGDLTARLDPADGFIVVTPSTTTATPPR